MVLPDKDTTFEEYTTIELLSVSILIVISTFALDFIHSDRSIFKIVDLDEAWAFLNVAQGETLSNKLVRAGRAMNAGVYFVTQSSGDVSKESLKNNIGLKFAFRSTDTNEIKQTLEFFGLDSEDENNQKRLRDLENGQCLMPVSYTHLDVYKRQTLFTVSVSVMIFRFPTHFLLRSTRTRKALNPATRHFAFPIGRRTR